MLESSGNSRITAFIVRCTSGYFRVKTAAGADEETAVADLAVQMMSDFALGVRALPLVGVIALVVVLLISPARGAALEPAR